MLEVILTQDVDNLGRAGDLVRVRPGYGRNYLLPRGMAITATRGGRAQVEHHKRSIARQQERIVAQYREMAKVLDQASVAIARKVGKDGKLFGSVTNKDISEALQAQNIELDRKLIHLDEPIKTVGTYEIPVRFNPDIIVELKVNVVGV